MYEIYLTKRALKDLEKIPRIEKEKIAIFLQKISQDPNKFARKLSNARIVAEQGLTRHLDFVTVAI